MYIFLGLEIQEEGERAQETCLQRMQHSFPEVRHLYSIAKTVQKAVPRTWYVRKVQPYLRLQAVSLAYSSVLNLCEIDGLILQSVLVVQNRHSEISPVEITKRRANLLPESTRVPIQFEFLSLEPDAPCSRDF